jgi:hypothetical protein
LILFSVCSKFLIIHGCIPLNIWVCYLYAFKLFLIINWFVPLNLLGCYRYAPWCPRYKWVYSTQPIGLFFICIEVVHYYKWVFFCSNCGFIPHMTQGYSSLQMVLVSLIREVVNHLPPSSIFGCTQVCTYTHPYEHTHAHPTPMSTF